MVKIVLWGAIALSLGIGTWQAKNMMEIENGQSIPEQVSFLDRPEYDWVRCTCPSGGEDPAGYWPPSMGLSNPDFIEHQKEMIRLEQQADQCNNNL